MKIAGWILLVFALLILVRGGIAEALTFGVLGAYLLHRAKQKQKEKQEKDKWENYHLSPQIVNLYSQYRDLYFKNQRQPNLKNIMARSFGYTFWYYLMFV